MCIKQNKTKQKQNHSSPVAESKHSRKNKIHLYPEIVDTNSNQKKKNWLDSNNVPFFATILLTDFLSW